MAQKLTGGIPAALDLNQDYAIVFSAINVADGSTVTAVKVSNASILAEQISGGDPGDLTSGPFMLVPGPES